MVLRSEIAGRRPGLAPINATPAEMDFQSEVVAIMDQNRIMSLATNRADGWPQVTIVGYVRDGLALYCAVGGTSQKFENIQADPRASIAIGHDAPGPIRGLSMAVKIAVVSENDEVQRINELLQTVYPEQVVFSPAGATSVLLRADPQAISLIDNAKGPPTLLSVDRSASVRLPA